LAAAGFVPPTHFPGLCLGSFGGAAPSAPPFFQAGSLSTRTGAQDMTLTGLQRPFFDFGQS
jgi:hypothetical protein